MAGTLDPDATGDYALHGSLENTDTFKLAGQEWYLWYDTETPGQWTISTAVEAQGAAYWTRDNDEPVGIYMPGGTATGSATVAATV